MYRQFLSLAVCALAFVGFSLPVYGATIPAQFAGAPLLADWDFGSGTPLVDLVAGRTMTVVEDNASDILLDTITDNNGVMLDVLRFAEAGDDDYTTVSHDAADQLDSGIIRIVGLNTGAFNDAVETIVSKDHMDFGAGGHFTVTFTRATASTGNLEVRMQSTSTSAVVKTSTPIVLDEYVDVVIPFGPAYGGLQLFVDRDLSDLTGPVLEDSNAFNGGIAGNLEPWIFGSSAIFHNPPASQGGIDETQLADGFSGAIAGFQIYGVPEPTAAVLLACALSIVGALHRRRAI